MKNPLAHPVFVVFAIASLAFVLPGAGVEPPAQQPDVLIVEHAYDGPIEQAGSIVAWRYSGAVMLLEWVDTERDGIFRNAFEVQP